MKLSAPVHELKSRAKKLKKRENLSLFEAQNRIAQEEGLSSWSLLMSKQKDVLPNSIVDLLDYLNPGDLVLLGARPQIGKTTVSAGLISAASHRGGPRSHFFTMIDMENVVRSRIEGHMEQFGFGPSSVNIDCSEGICADMMMEKLGQLPADQLRGALVVVDYLQILDQRRDTPPLQNQIESLNLFAKQTGCIFFFLTQLARDVEKYSAEAPNEDDIRLPNPLDLGLINKLLFLYKPASSDSKEQESREETRLAICKPQQHEFEVRLHRSVFALQSAGHTD